MDVINWFNRAKIHKINRCKNACNKEVKPLCLEKEMLSFNFFCLVVSAGESKNWKCLTIQKLEFLEFCFVFVDYLCFGDVSVNFKVTIELPVKFPIKMICSSSFSFLTFPWPLMTFDDLEKVTIGFPVKFPIKMMCHMLGIAIKKFGNLGEFFMTA